MSEGSAEIPKEELQKVYSLLADATDAAATGDPNECASKAADAKERVVALHAMYYDNE